MNSVVNELLMFLYCNLLWIKASTKYVKVNVLKLKLLSRTKIAFIGPDANYCLLSSYLENFNFYE